MKTTIQRLTAASAVCAALISVAGCSASNEPETPGSQPPTTVFVDPSYETDITDQRKLAGDVDAVFVGTVMEQTGTKTRGVMPETQFRVNVVEVLKGDVNGDVTVNQQGGIHTESGDLLLMAGDELITAGNSYLFAVKHSPQESWYTLVPGVGDIPLAAADVQLMENSENSRSDSPEPPEVAQMRDSIANEIPFEPGG